MTGDDRTLIDRLTEALRTPLPGSDAQQRMAPRLLDGTRLPRVPGHRLAAALVLLFERDDRWHLVLTLRASHLPHHADQVSLPGGRLEAGETAEAAALREAHEEVGVAPDLVRVLGRLTPLHIPVSGFTLQAIVGVADGPLTFRHEPGEVADVLEVALDDLLCPGSVSRAAWVRESRELDVPYFDVAGHQVWGATAMVLSELLTLLGHEIDPWRPGSPAPSDP